MVSSSFAREFMIAICEINTFKGKYVLFLREFL